MKVSIERVGVVSGTRYNAFLKVKNLRKVVNDGKGCGSVNPRVCGRQNTW